MDLHRVLLKKKKKTALVSKSQKDMFQVVTTWD